MLLLPVLLLLLLLLWWRLAFELPLSLQLRLLRLHSFPGVADSLQTLLLLLLLLLQLLLLLLVSSDRGCRSRLCCRCHRCFYRCCFRCCCLS